MTETLERLKASLADRYTLERELGRGGMATVYRARDLKHDRPVALKVLRPDLAASLGSERFLREIRLTARLEHPHILPILDSGDAVGLLWYTMPYVRGESLRDRLSREIQLPVEIAVDLTRQVASALDYAHREGVVHRDLKPENILVANGQARVADFGIAKTILGTGEGTLTDRGLAVGTPAYMSPEQASGGPVDARTDVYALGCVLYEMLAGEPPYTGRTPQAVIAKRLSDPVPHVRTVRESVPQDLERTLTRALAKVPADRFETAAEFARALAVAAALAPVGTSPDTQVVDRVAFAAPNGLASAEVHPAGRRVPRTVATLLIGLLLGLGVLFAWSRSRSTDDVAERVEKRVAVLPFENLGRAEDEYFADGITDELRGKLATVAGLQVIASASSSQYKHSQKPLEQIAQELGVQYLLVGKVRWEKRPAGESRVRVSPELVQVGSGGAPTTRWQQPFDASLTDVFQVQADIAGRVAQALDIALGAGERERLAERPTANLAAYDAFLRGEAAAQSLASWDLPALRRAVAFYEEAVARDSTFAVAWAQLAQANALLYGWVSDPVEGEAARRALAIAERLAPNAAETYQARAAFEDVVRRDPPRTLAAAEAGLARTPGDWELMAIAAGAEFRLGRFEAAVARLKRARTINPRSVTVASFLAVGLYFQRRWGEARRVLDDVLSLEPPDLLALESRAITYLGEGNLAGARRVLAEAPPSVDRTQLAVYVAWHGGLYWVPDEDMQQRVLTLPPSSFDNDRGIWALVRTQLYYLRGDTAMARVYADSAQIAFEAQLQVNPRDAGLHSYRGLALAYLGQKPEAIGEGERGAALLPTSRDAYRGPSRQHSLVRIYLLVGEPEKALDQLESLLSLPYYLSPGWLKVDPAFAPLRGNPRFERLVAAK